MYKLNLSISQGVMLIDCHNFLLNNRDAPEEWMEHNHLCSWTKYTIFLWMDFLVISACSAWKLHITSSLIHLSILTVVHWNRLGKTLYFWWSVIENTSLFHLSGCFLISSNVSMGKSFWNLKYKKMKMFLT